MFAPFCLVTTLLTNDGRLGGDPPSLPTGHTYLPEFRMNQIVPVSTFDSASALCPGAIQPGNAGSALLHGMLGRVFMCLAAFSIVSLFFFVFLRALRGQLLFSG